MLAAEGLERSLCSNGLERGILMVEGGLSVPERSPCREGSEIVWTRLRAVCPELQLASGVAAVTERPTFDSGVRDGFYDLNGVRQVVQAEGQPQFPQVPVMKTLVETLACYATHFIV